MEKYYYIWFSKIQGITTRKKHILLDKYKSVKEIFNLTLKKLQKNMFLNENEIKQLLDKKMRRDVYIDMEVMKEKDIDVINYLDDEYPIILKQIYDYPITLYIKGNKDILNNNSCGIIGCRKYTKYGKKATQYFAENLAKADINIISGMAKGIDSFAHQGALDVSGRTIAVLGSGVDVIYPKENEKLYYDIIKFGGAVISEYPIGTKPFKYNFPNRNRIVSGMSKKILVIEATKKSGTLITVDCALEQGRDVYAVPGNINEVNSLGTNDLIKQGAKIVTNYEDILKD